MMTTKSQDHYMRVCCAIVWSDRRCGESFRDAAQRAVDAIAATGQKGVDIDTALEWACLERADRVLVNMFRQGQNIRGGRGTFWMNEANENRFAQLLTMFRQECGLEETND